MGRQVSRPAQGPTDTVKPPRPAYRSEAAPRIVSQGSVSRPARRPTPRLGRYAADAAPKVVRK